MWNEARAGVRSSVLKFHFCLGVASEKFDLKKQ